MTRAASPSQPIKSDWSCRSRQRYARTHDLHPHLASERATRRILCRKSARAAKSSTDDGPRILKYSPAHDCPNP